MNGILVIDKPENMTSAKVVSILKKLLKAGKVGHAGTLDPMATGVLVCCINRATRLANFFLQGSKKYEAILHLGVATDTQDATGTIVASRKADGFSEETIKAVFEQFKGTSQQVPPVFSALKHKGVALHKLARQGKFVHKPARRVRISRIKILKIDLPEIGFEVTCSAGTYIRTLCADIGMALGCGGHLKKLRRLESGGFTLREALGLGPVAHLAQTGELTGQIISMTDALRSIPRHMADGGLTEKIQKGRIITRQDLMAQHGAPSTDTCGGLLKIVSRQNDLLAVLQYNPEQQRFSYCCAFPNEN